MTKNSAYKKIIRARMEATGSTYMQAEKAFAQQSESLSAYKYSPSTVLAQLRTLINSEPRLNILVAGKTGVGKTTMVANLLGFLPSSKSVAVAQQHNEILSPERHYASNVHEISFEEAVNVRTDYLVVDEVRDATAVEALRAKGKGFIGVIHSTAMTWLIPGSNGDDGSKPTLPVDIIVLIKREYDSPHHIEVSITDLRNSTPNSQAYPNLTA